MNAQELCKFACASSIRELNRIYTEEDQCLMKAGRWDYDNPLLLTNFIKEALEGIDAGTLTDEENEWRTEILWFWYHHAISCAVWKKKDKLAAKYYAAMAVLLQGSDHPNKITSLLLLLVHDFLEQAMEWAEQIEDEVEKETASSLIDEYKRGEFF